MTRATVFMTHNIEGRSARFFKDAFYRFPPQQSFRASLLIICNIAVMAMLWAPNRINYTPASRILIAPIMPPRCIRVVYCKARYISTAAPHWSRPPCGRLDRSKSIQRGSILR
jgi:hypothetical protein